MKHKYENKANYIIRQILKNKDCLYNNIYDTISNLDKNNQKSINYVSLDTSISTQIKQEMKQEMKQEINLFMKNNFDAPIITIKQVIYNEINELDKANYVTKIFTNIYQINNTGMIYVNFPIIFINYDKKYILLGSTENFGNVKRYLIKKNIDTSIHIVSNDGIIFNSCKKIIDDDFAIYVSIIKIKLGFTPITLREVINLKIHFLYFY
jgi:hypothetical protein